MHVWLIGMMGSGKSVVGKILAAKWGAGAVDLDREIERSAGASVAAIFRGAGEPTFRRIEARHLARVAAADRASVIATGGGAVLSDENVRTMRESGRVVWLDAPVSVLAKRVSNGGRRPLLAGKSAAATLKRILAGRRERYGAAADIRVDAGKGTAAAVATRVVAALSPSPIAYDGGNGATQVHVEDGLLDRSGSLVRERLGDGALAIVVTDDAVGPLYARRLRRSLSRAGYRVREIRVRAGERHKNAATVVSLWNEMAAAGVERRTPVIALGGGVVGDLAGFAAATVLRGVPVVQVPTTLVAQVDSAIGGKTGFDLAAGKNLVGAFKQPALVLADPSVLRTLPRAELRAGMAEVVKYGTTLDEVFFGMLEEAAWPLGAANAERIVRRCATLKAAVVERDPEERGERAILNFGHTIGHALEAASRFRVRHGEAVAAGMVAESALSECLGVCRRDDVERLRALLGRFGLSTEIRVRGARAFLRADKKRVGAAILLPLLRRIGRVELRLVEIRDLRRSIR